MSQTFIKNDSLACAITFTLKIYKVSIRSFSFIQTSGSLCVHHATLDSSTINDFKKNITLIEMHHWFVTIHSESVLVQIYTVQEPIFHICSPFFCDPGGTMKGWTDLAKIRQLCSRALWCQLLLLVRSSLALDASTNALLHNTLLILLQVYRYPSPVNFKCVLSSVYRKKLRERERWRR